MVKSFNKASKISKAKNRVVEVLKEIQVAYDRELRYRLESEFPHDVVGLAISELERETVIKRTNVPGRKGSGDTPNIFYRLPSSDYRSILPLMRRKLELAKAIQSVSSDMGRYAEEVWFNAFKENGWETYPSNVEEIGGVREFKGKKAGNDIKKDIDFIACKDGIAYGVEIKNRFSYPDDLFWKIIVATDLDVIPLIIVRWLNPSQVKAIPELGGFYVVYKTAIYSPSLEGLVNDAVKVLKYPIECRSKIDDSFFKNRVEKIHDYVSENLDSIKDKLRKFREDIAKFRYWQSRLGSVRN